MKLSFGSNSLPASSSFDERSKFFENYPSGIFNQSSVDYWRGDILFGRIDQNQDPIYPSEQALKALPSEEGSLFALNFVSDAFRQFKGDIELLRAEGLVYPGGFIEEKNLEPTKGWQDVNKEHDSYLNSFFENTIFPFMSSDGINQSIENFYDFVEQFTNLIDRSTLLVPFTKTEFIISNYGTPLYSGLAVEIDDSLQYGEDAEKILFYVNDNNFEIYRQTAANNGFVLDKNAPWRLIAIPYSSQIQKQMDKYGITNDTLVDRYYYRSHNFDIPNLKVYMREFYNTFAKALPTIRVPIISGSGKKRSLTKVIARDTMGKEKYSEEWFFDNPFWIRLYVYIRAKETNRDWNQYKFDQVASKAAEFFIHSGEEAAYKFINKEVRRPFGENFQLDRYRRGTFTFKRKRG